MRRKFAVFDIDGTIIRTSLFFQIVDELLAAGHLASDLRIQLDAKLEAYRLREHSEAFNQYAETSVDILFNNLARLKVADYRKAVDSVVRRSHGEVYVYTRDLAQSLKQRGYFLIALSGSEMYAIQQFTSFYDFDLVIGDSYEEHDGVFSGNIDNSVFHDKGSALKKIVAEHDLTYEGSIAIGDSYGDAKMLALVENPIAFNPEAKLFEAAKQQGWKVVIERKNMTYTLVPQEGSDGSYILA